MVKGSKLRPSDYDLDAKFSILDLGVSKRRPSEADILKVQQLHNLRSPRAKGIDEASTRNVTSSIELWASDPARVDFMGVDTAKPKKKKGVKKRR